MKKFFSTSLVLLFAGSCILHTATLEEILKKNYRARGGYEKLKSIDTVKIEGVFLQQNLNMEMPMKMWFAKPNHIRVEVEYQGKTIVQAFDGETVWWIMPFKGCDEPRKMPPDQAAEIVDQAESMDPLVDYKELGHELELVGLEMMEGTPVYKLRMTKHSGRVTLFYLDKESGLELKIASRVKRGDDRILVESLPGDYQDVDGILVPFEMETRVDGKMAARVVFHSYIFNPHIDENLFHMPQAESSIE